MNRRHSYAMLVTLLVAYPSALLCQQKDSLSAGGCYVLSIGTWMPPLGADAQFHVPRDTVRLLRDTVAGRTGWYRADPPIRHQYSRGHERAMWMPVDAYSLRVFWGDDFTGADLRLFQGAWALFGVIRASSDAIVAEEKVPKATVVAKQIECRT